MMARMDGMPGERRGRLRELARLFTRLGFTAFGGPAAHVAMMEDEIVTRRKWLDRQHFLDIVAAINFIPGPNSTELAIHIGQLRAGWRGLIVAGACFITPAVLIILPLAWAYVKWGATPQIEPALVGIRAAVAAIVAFATFRFAQTALKDSFTIAVMCAVVGCAAILARFPRVQPEIPSLALAAIAGAVWYRRRQSSPTLLAIALPLGFWPDLLRLAGSMLKIGMTLFGSGYVLVSYLQSDMVDRYGWLTQQQLFDAIAVGQFTPGPLLTTATFVGYVLGDAKFGGGTVGGIIGAIVATLAIFAPSFLFVAIFGPMLQRIRQKLWARGALDAMNAAVVGLMIVVALRLAGAAMIDNARSMRLNLLAIIVFIVALVGLWKKINTTWLILGSGVVGVAWHFVSHPLPTS
jgi:chromate transporter